MIEMTSEEFRRKYGKKAAVRPARAAAKQKKEQVDWPAELLRQVKAAGLPEPTPEFVFHPTRLWRMDFAWPDRKLAAEVHGGVWTHGRHTRGGGFTEDREKMNQAVLLGWRVLEFTSEMVESGRAIKLLEQVLLMEG